MAGHRRIDLQGRRGGCLIGNSLGERDRRMAVRLNADGAVLWFERRHRKRRWRDEMDPYRLAERRALWRDRRCDIEVELSALPVLGQRQANLIAIDADLRGHVGGGRDVGSGEITVALEGEALGIVQGHGRGRHIDEMRPRRHGDFEARGFLQRHAIGRLCAGDGDRVGLTVGQAGAALAAKLHPAPSRIRGVNPGSNGRGRLDVRRHVLHRLGPREAHRVGPARPQSGTRQPGVRRSNGREAVLLVEEVGPWHGQGRPRRRHAKRESIGTIGPQ